MRTPLPYYGGKSKMLPHIRPLRPLSIRKYTDVYCGGAADFWDKSPSYLEVLNDIDHNLMNFYDMMQNKFEKLLVKIESTLFHEALHLKARDILKSPKGYNKIDRAWAYWVSINFSFTNKIGGGFGFCNGRDSGHSGITAANRIDEFKFYKYRLARTQIHTRPAMEVLDMRNHKEFHHFIDPPYPRTNQGHFAKTKFTIERFLELLDYLEREIKGTFMLCNYWHPELKAFLKRNPHWNIHYFNMPLSANGHSRRSRKTEIIIRNYTTTPTLFS